MGKTALIVDDSRSARAVLKKMLESHALAVDTTESAEDALVYLNEHRPDVIFMDHLMPGMDGFEAVSAIKNNPNTATIPIMMYTSQEGEVYVGQARALGAVGVLPKRIEPVEVSKVLQSLHVIGGGNGAPVTDVPDSAPPETGGAHPDVETPDRNLRLSIEDLFTQQRALLRRDLFDVYETIATRVADKIRPADIVPEDEAEVADENRSASLLQGAVALLVLVAMIFAWLYWQREQSWQALQARQVLLQQELEIQRASGAEDSLQARQQIDDFQRSIDAMYSTTLSSLEWGANQATLYTYEELPLGDTRLTVIEQLAGQLATVGFSGVVRVETHVGDFCLTANGIDGYALAPGNLLAMSCDRIGVSPGEAHELGLRQSVAFANFIRLADQRSAGRIRYEIVSRGNSDPVMVYPATPEIVRASAWNEIAGSNNRVEISIYPD